MPNVKLILREDVPNLGDAGELVSVKPGYARNFLIPNGKAVVASEANVSQLEHQKRVIAEKLAKELKDLRAVRDRIQSQQLEVTVQAGEEGRLFGSVTSQQIAELLASRGIQIDRRKIDLAEPIKQVGDFSVDIKLRGDVVAKVKITVKAAE
jgi:large subunit ribosomal protein L9